MQRSWRLDADKLTFIICLPISSHIIAPLPNGKDDTTHQYITIKPSTYDNHDTMLGDINLFLTPLEQDMEAADINSFAFALPSNQIPLVGEIELMIALSKNQSRGFGHTSLLTFLLYIGTHESEIVESYLKDNSSDFGQLKGPSLSSPSSSDLQLSYLRARISATNVRSIALFKKVGFELVSEEPNYFGELEMRLQREGWGSKNIKSLFKETGIEETEWTEIRYE
ncbi:putative n-acetyltransferase 9 [Phaeomoniella chlamydospora]|uniref:Putative n-acetyltransferase 9 n=1 Tax=Phaeomoniella chlamydospora TaxID=158046 RepID=A0A0G2HL64_PHACM|nr:putative n-acetyltransferase 9 [Phaeomoniella chlamydospora]